VVAQQKQKSQMWHFAVLGCVSYILITSTFWSGGGVKKCILGCSSLNKNVLFRTLTMERRNDIVKLATKKIAEALNIDLLEAADEVIIKKFF
jgi:hypothetical protein